MSHHPINSLPCNTQEVVRPAATTTLEHAKKIWGDLQSRLTPNNNIILIEDFDTWNEYLRDTIQQ